MHVSIRLPHPFRSAFKRIADVQSFRGTCYRQAVVMHLDSVLCNSPLTQQQVTCTDIDVSEGFAPLGVSAPFQPVDREGLWPFQRDDRQRFYKRTHIKALLQRTKDIAGETLVIVIPEEVGSHHIFCKCRKDVGIGPEAPKI
jgi:hypothetical protein